MGRRNRGRWDIPPAGEIHRLHLDSLSHQGAAIGRLDGQVVFAAYGIPGEEVDVFIEKVHKDYLEGRVTAVHQPSPYRVAARCQYFGACGGCQLQHISYEGQLELKRQIVAEQMRRIGKLPDVPVLPVLPSPNPWYYRNHARFTVDRDGFLGFTLRGRKRIVRTMTCYIHDPWICDTMQLLQGRCRGLRQIALRTGVQTGDRLIQPALDGKLSDRPLASDGEPLPPLPEPLPVIDSGQRQYDECLLGSRFHVSAASFFQVNTPQAENLIRLVRDGLALGPDDVFLDAYAGVGTFAKTLAPLVKQAIAIEVSASSVADGRRNTEDVANVEWRLGEVEAILPQMVERPDAVVLDPSRQGCGVPALEALITARVPRLAYVSCEPATLARDLRILVDGGFRITALQPVDMFPQTYHIECVAVLRRD